MSKSYKEKKYGAWKFNLCKLQGNKKKEIDF